MDWSNEDYVRLYTRETADDLELSWEAIALWRAMICKFDRSGVIPVRNGWPSIARMVRMPVDVVERAGPELVTDGRVRVTKHGFVAPNFTEAQTASKSDKLRQRESRDRRREVALTEPTGITKRRHDRSQAVTNRDPKSRDVTLPLLSVAPVAPVALPPVVETADAVTPKSTGRTKPTSDHLEAFRAARTEFSDHYQTAYGTEPTWAAKQNTQLSKLVKAHGPDEVRRRIGILFNAPPAFLSGPHDVGTLAQHFDKLVQPSLRRVGGDESPASRDVRVGRVEPDPNYKYPDGDLTHLL